MPPLPHLDSVDEDTSVKSVTALDIQDDITSADTRNLQICEGDSKLQHFSTHSVMHILRNAHHFNLLRRVSSTSNLNNIAYQSFQGMLPTAPDMGEDKMSIISGGIIRDIIDNDILYDGVGNKSTCEHSNNAVHERSLNNRPNESYGDNNVAFASSARSMGPRRQKKSGSHSYNKPESDTNTFETTIEEKGCVFWEYFTKIFSCIYAVFVVTLGLVVYLTDVFLQSSYIKEGFSMYLIVVSLIYVLFLTTDIRIFLNRKRKHTTAVEVNAVNGNMGAQGYRRASQLSTSISLNENENAPKHDYCFSKGRHSGSFFLKLGAAVFCLGHLIHCGILLGYQIVFMNSKGDTLRECASVVTLILDIIYPVYSFLLLYFIFKYSNVIINRAAALARFGFMHCLASSICFWVWTILREIQDALFQYYLIQPSNDEDDSSVDSSSEKTNRHLSFTYEALMSIFTSNSAGVARDSSEQINPSVRMSFSKCESEDGVMFIYQNYSPYLYPFSVEFNILVVGVLFIIWQNISECGKLDTLSTDCRMLEPDSDNEESNLVIYADCHSANKGLFAGIVVFVLCIINIILYFVGVEDENYSETALLVVILQDIILMSLMIIVCIFAYRQITKLDVNGHPISLLDDLLLFICIPAFFLFAIFGSIPAVLNQSIKRSALIVLQLLQMLVQTPLIIDGLRRCSNSKLLRKAKLGRELITFLIVCNVSLWVTQTFKVKSSELQDFKYEYYGKVLWTVLGHATTPLIMFYRFHSAVCLVDIWISAYEPEQH